MEAFGQAATGLGLEEDVNRSRTSSTSSFVKPTSPKRAPVTSTAGQSDQIAAVETRARAVKTELEQINSEMQRLTSKQESLLEEQQQLKRQHRSLQQQQREHQDQQQQEEQKVPAIKTPKSTHATPRSQPKAEAPVAPIAAAPVTCPEPAAAPLESLVSARPVRKGRAMPTRRGRAARATAAPAEAAAAPVAAPVPSVNQTVKVIAKQAVSEPQISAEAAKPAARKINKSLFDSSSDDDEAAPEASISASPSLAAR